jgi:phospholipid transport system substrate-binding protein
MGRAGFVVTRRAPWLAAVLSVALAAPVWAGPPTDQLRRSVDQAVAILNDPALSSPAKLPERRVGIRKVAQGIFDFQEMARRTLGQHWSKLDETERQEFSKLFAGLLEQAYASRIERYEGEQVTWVSETIQPDGTFATVRTKITPKSGSPVPIDYNLVKRDDRWLVYDIFVEGISLVANYRVQFDRVLRTGSYDDLVKRMRAREGELAKPSTPRGS